MQVARVSRSVHEKAQRCITAPKTFSTSTKTLDVGTMSVTVRCVNKVEMRCRVRGRVIRTSGQQEQISYLFGQYHT